jgi:nondiscriminating glutamyl-tRNA synthetase
MQRHHGPRNQQFLITWDYLLAGNPLFLDLPPKPGYTKNIVCWPAVRILAMTTPVRVRFAPSPTGMMHLGNVRTALLNYLFARQKNGTVILRIEDTDPERNFDPNGVLIIKDLQWLGLSYDEGPHVGGPYAPYQQSARNHLYQEQLDILEGQKLVYRCFCTPQELERKRQRAIALKQPPRYDRTCLNLPEAKIHENMAQGIPFVWRFKVPQTGSVSITDLAHGITTFELHNFSDFALSRADGSFTFLFSNAIDDMLMKITHVLRGADHLSNTANQALLFQAFNKPLPLFWHLPIICNVEGKKLSKRDFGFALEHLQEAGFLPEAVVNYLAIIGLSFKEEIMSLEELIAAMNFDEIRAAGNIRYDVDKLRWVNHKWLQKYSGEQLTQVTMPFLQKAYPEIKKLDQNTITKLLQAAKAEMTTLEDSVPALRFYFFEPQVDPRTVQEHILPEHQQLIKDHLTQMSNLLDTPELWVKTIQEICRAQKIPQKTLFTALRLALTGEAKGPSLLDILTILGPIKSRERLMKIFGI